MSEHKPVLEYASPLDVQPPDSRLIVTESADELVITDPPADWNRLGGHAAVIVICAVFFVLSASATLRAGGPSGGAVVVLFFATLVGGFAIFELALRMRKPTIIRVTASHMIVQRPRVVGRVRRFPIDGQLHIRTSLGTFGLGGKHVLLADVIIVRSPPWLRWIWLGEVRPLRNRPRLECEWLVRRLRRRIGQR